MLHYDYSTVKIIALNFCYHSSQSMLVHFLECNFEISWLFICFKRTCNQLFRCFYDFCFKVIFFFLALKFLLNNFNIWFISVLATGISCFTQFVIFLVFGFSEHFACYIKRLCSNLNILQEVTMLMFDMQVVCFCGLWSQCQGDFFRSLPNFGLLLGPP